MGLIVDNNWILFSLKMILGNFSEGKNPICLFIESWLEVNDSPWDFSIEEPNQNLFTKLEKLM